MCRSFARDLRICALVLSLFIADAPADMPNVTLMMPAAQARSHERSFVGSATTSMLEQLTFDPTFLTIGGVDVDAGYTEYEFDDAERRRLHSGVRGGRS